MSWEMVATGLHGLGILAYGSVLVVFSVLLPWRGRTEPWRVDRAFRACGAVSGLGVGAIFLGGFLRIWLLHGGFTWGVQTTAQQLELAKHLVFGALWASYTILEIWTLEPLRKLDSGVMYPPLDAYLPVRRRVVRHLHLNTFLFVVTFVLGLLGAT